MQLEQLDYDHSLHTTNKGDDGLFVVFSVEAVKLEDKSLEEGRDIYEDTEYVRIMVPGDRNNVIHRPVRPEDKRRFPRQYQMFKVGQAEKSIGTPLQGWPLISKAMAKELEYFGITTIEALASAPDGNLMKIGGAIELKQKAAAFLTSSKSTAHDLEMAELRAANERQQAQLNELMARLNTPEPAVEKQTAPAKK